MSASQTKPAKLPPSLRLHQLALFEATSRQLATFPANATVSLMAKKPLEILESVCVTTVNGGWIFLYGFSYGSFHLDFQYVLFITEFHMISIVNQLMFTSKKQKKAKKFTQRNHVISWEVGNLTC